VGHGVGALGAHEIDDPGQALAQHKTQALSILDFMERHPERLWTETFHLPGSQGTREGPWW
jgi:hypothetical protein